MDRRTLLLAGAAGLGRAALPPGIVALAGCGGTASVPGTTGFDGATMGTHYSVRLHAPLAPGRLAALRTAVDTALAGVDERMSTYRPGSELSRFNRQRDTGWRVLSPETTRVVAQALAASRASQGAFDVTVGPLVELWGFGPGGPVSRAPDDLAIGRLLEQVGWRHIEIDVARCAVRKTRVDGSLDLSGIAKGFAVDAAAAALEARGVGDFLIEVGGELCARGHRPGATPWRVAIERPVLGRRSVHRVIDLRGRAIATSGDYHNFFVDRNTRYSHAIDPRSGSPVKHRLASASVIADSAMLADAASTTLMVLGPEAGAEWARVQGVAGHFLVREGEQVREHWTPAFEAHLSS